MSQPWPPGQEPGEPDGDLGTVKAPGDELAREWPLGAPGHEYGRPQPPGPDPEPDPPQPGSISPATGPAAGGTPVSIGGTDFTDATGAAIGGSPLTQFTALSDTQVSGQAPPGTAGPAHDVTVTGPAGTGTLPAAYAYLALPGPQVISPASGYVSGGYEVTIGGSGGTLAGATGATIGGNPLTQFSVQNANQVKGTAPPGAAGTAQVQVTGPGGTGTMPGSFTYTEPPPDPQAISPANGYTAGGYEVTITGAAFGGATGATAGGNALTQFTVQNAGQIKGIMPPGAAGPAQVQVTGPGGTGTMPGSFTYTEPPPDPQAITPASGYTIGGYEVTITGAALAGATSAAIGGTPLGQFTVQGAGQVKGTAPPGAAGTAQVQVTGPGGTGMMPGSFTYTEPPAPQAAFSYSPPEPEASDTVTFDGSASAPGDPGYPITGYDWLFNNTATRSGQVVTWNLPSGSGDYPARLTVTAADGQSDSSTQIITV